MRFNPLKVGSYCNWVVMKGGQFADSVSIPLKSGHIVTKIKKKESEMAEEFSFNPLKVGSYCNYAAMEDVVLKDVKVSIPLKSGHIVTFI